MDYKDYYQILGVARNADEKEIKRAFRKLAQQYHPDKNPGDAEAERKFKEVNEAHTVLSDPEKRSKYDRFGSQWEQYTRSGGRPEDFNWGGFGGNGGGHSRTVSPEEFEQFMRGSNFSDFFETLFGGEQGGRRGGTRFRTGGGNSFDPFTGGQARSQNQEVPVQITLEEAFQGTSRTLESSDGTRMQANIPRGVQSGSKVRMRGAAGQGDILLKVEVKPHEQFTRSGDDLRVQVPVDLYTALLGGEVAIPTLERSVMLTVPAGTQSGRIFRLRGLGMPKLKEPDQRGDLLAEVAIKLPTELTAEEKELFQKLRSLRSSR
ncbi:MAG: J domain-containing protein [Caldilineaceae bacterium]|nr:J domain-containing protein [Caldilineaceae bacterium]